MYDGDVSFAACFAKRCSYYARIFLWQCEGEALAILHRDEIANVRRTIAGDDLSGWAEENHPLPTRRNEYPLTRRYAAILKAT